MKRPAAFVCAVVLLSLSVWTYGAAQQALNANLMIGGSAVSIDAGATDATTLRTITASDSPDVTGIGSTSDAAATAGGTGSVSAKLRVMSSDIDAVKTAVQTIDNAISGSGLNISQIGGATPISSRCLDDSKVTTAVINEASSGNNEVVAISSTTVIYVCGYDLIADGDVDVQWIYGTGTACATGETDISHLYPFDSTNGRGVVRPNGGGVQMKAPAGNALCLELSGAVQVSGYVTYVQE